MDQLVNSQELFFNKVCAKDIYDLGITCDICQKLLSVPPITHNCIFGNICGRSTCREIAGSKGKLCPQTAYEVVAQYLEFPCMYRENGCQARLKWQDVEEHENACDFKNFICPFMQKVSSADSIQCPWNGSHSAFLNHMEEDHSSCMFLHSLQISLKGDFIHNTAELFFTKIQGEMIIVVLIKDKETNSFFCNIWAGIRIYKNLHYQVKIFDQEFRNSTALKKKSVDILSFQFVRSEIKEKFLKIDLDNLENFIENPSVMSVEFEFLGYALGVPSIKIQSENSPNNYSLDLKEAKCDLCSNELIPPVSLCSSAHNICRACVNLGKEENTRLCKKCSSSIIQTRNIAYEKLKFLVSQPCKNQSRGCDYKGPYPDIKNHEQNCLLNPRKCILGCSDDVDNMYLHLTIEHRQSITDLDTLHCLNRLKSHVFLFDGQIFLFTKKLVIDEGFSFVVECLGTKEVKYQYELSLINEKFIGSAIMLSQLCHPEGSDLKKHENATLKGLMNKILIPSQVLQQLFPDYRNLKFKMKIFEIEKSNVP